MGRNKASLPGPNGRTFLHHAVERLKQVADGVAVSGDNTNFSGVANVPDAIDQLGPVVGIASVLSFARDHKFTACLVTPIDVPSLTTDDLRKLSASWRGNKQLTFAQSDRVEPLIGIYPVDLADELTSLAQSNDRSLFRWIQNQQYTALPFPADRIQNINTPDDLSKL